MHLGINNPNELVCSQKPNSPSDQSISQAGSEHVPEVQETSTEPGDLQLSHVIDNAVGEQIQPRAPWHPNTDPPPPVVFFTQQNVSHQYGHLSRCDYEHDKAEEQKPEQVVERNVVPDALHDITELDKHAPKG